MDTSDFEDIFNAGLSTQKHYQTPYDGRRRRWQLCNGMQMKCISNQPMGETNGCWVCVQAKREFTHWKRISLLFSVLSDWPCQCLRITRQFRMRSVSLLPSHSPSRSRAVGIWTFTFRCCVLIVELHVWYSDWTRTLHSVMISSPYALVKISTDQPSPALSMDSTQDS